MGKEAAEGGETPAVAQGNAYIERIGGPAAFLRGLALGQVARTLGGEGVADGAHAAAVTHREVDLLAVAAPKLLHGAIGVQGAAAQLLADVDVEAMTLAHDRVQRPPALVLIFRDDALDQAQITGGGVAIGQQREVGAGAVQLFAVRQPQAVALDAPVAGQAAFGSGQVSGESADAGIGRHAKQPRGVPLGGRRAGVSRPHAVQAALVNGLGEQRVVCQAGLLDLAGDQAVTLDSAAQKLRRGRIGHHAGVFLAVGLGDFD